MNKATKLNEIKEIKQINVGFSSDTSEINSLLENGWQLLAITPNGGYAVYILGRV